MSGLAAGFCLAAGFRCFPLPLHLNRRGCLLKPCNGKFFNRLQRIFRILSRFRCLGCSAARLADTPARSTSRARLHSAAFQPRHGSEQRAQLLKVLQRVCCERFGCRILPCFKVQMLSFSTASEPVEVLAETVQRKVSQCVVVVCLSFFPVQMPGLFCCAFGGYPCQKHLQGTFAFRGIPALPGICTSGVLAENLAMCLL